MTKIAGLPVKTRLPLIAWVIAGLVTCVSLLSSLLQLISSGGIGQIQHASMMGLLQF